MEPPPSSALGSGTCGCLALMISEGRFRRCTLTLSGGPWRPFPASASVRSGAGRSGIPLGAPWSS
eukprot:4588845-Alexandrium_andersonii.AAC.1